MNKHLLLSGLLLLCVSTAAAQKKPKDPKFGEVEAWEWALSDFKGDTTVGAIEIFDIGKFEFDANPESRDLFRFTRHRRIKILKAAKADELANVEISYLPEVEQFIEFKAHTLELGPDGRTIKHVLPKDAIREEKLANDRRSGRPRLRRFSLPNVKPGTIIETTYTLSGSVVEPPSWDFQAQHPKLVSRMVLVAPTAITFGETFRGNLKLTKSYSEKEGQVQLGYNTFDIIRKLYQIDSVKAFGNYSFIYNEDNYISGVDIDFKEIRLGMGTDEQLKKSWFSLSRDVQKDKMGFNEDELREPLVIELAGQLKDADTLTTIRNIYNYLRKEIKTLKLTDSERDRSSLTLREAIRTKSAPSSLKTILGLRLLSIMGYDPALVFIRERSSGFVKKKDPSLRQFDHFVLLVSTSKREYLIDLEDNAHPFNVLPREYFNSEAWMVTKDADAFVTLPMEASEDRSITLNGKLSAKGELTGAFTVRETGYAAIDVRARWVAKGTHYWAHKELFDEPNLIKLTSFKADTTVSREEPVIVLGEFVKADFAQEVDGELYFNPILIDRVSETPLKQETRDFPVEFDSRFNHQYLLNLELPAGYTVAELPKPVRIVLPDKSMEFTRAVSAQEGRLTISIRHINRREVYPVEAYEALRKIYDAVVSAMAEQIILKPTK